MKKTREGSILCAVDVGTPWAEHHIYTESKAFDILQIQLIEISRKSVFLVEYITKEEVEHE